jgi:hypothetical protein
VGFDRVVGKSPRRSSLHVGAFGLGGFSHGKGRLFLLLEHRIFRVTTGDDVGDEVA